MAGTWGRCRLHGGFIAIYDPKLMTDEAANPTQSENSLLQNSWAEQSWILWTFNICVKGRRDLFIHESKFTHDPSLLWTLIIKVDYVRRSRFHSSTTSFFMALLRLLNFSDFKNLHDRVMSLMTVAVKLYIYIYIKRAFVLFSTGEVLIWPTFYAYSSSLSTSPK